MSLDVETRLKTYLVSAPAAVRSIKTVELSHSQMSQTYYLWQEPYEGTITTESGVRTVQPVHFEIDWAGAEGHLDQAFDVRLDTTDIEDEFREELDRISVGTTEKIVMVYREYLSDDLADIVAGPATLQVEAVSFKRGVASMSAVSPRFNTTRTGEIYGPRDIPMQRGFL
jgi:hypothetical protein